MRKLYNKLFFLILLPLFFFVIVLASICVYWVKMKGVSKGLVAVTPQELEQIAGGHNTDPEGEALSASFSTATQTETLRTRCPFLVEFGGVNRALLLRHLETSAAWYVGGMPGKMFAYRRYLSRGKWINPTNGFISASAQSSLLDPTRLNEYRILFLLDGSLDQALRIPFNHQVPSDAIEVDLRGSNGVDEQGYKSNLRICSNPAKVEIYEQSGSPSRPFTRAAIVELNKEFDAVLKSPAAHTRGFDEALMPLASVKRGDSELTLLADASDGQIYHLQGYVNAGESGFIHLKSQNAGFGSVTVNPHGVDAVEHVGWSDDVQEKFFCNITLDFSSFMTHHAQVRLEVWFTPDAGGPDRKLIEGLFNIKTRED